MEYVMATVTWTIDRSLRKHYVGDRLHSFRYKGRIIFHDLDVIDRVRAGLPTMKPNPRFNPDYPVSDRNLETIPMIDSDDDHEIVVTGSIEPDESAARTIITNRMNRIKANWERKLKAKPARAIVALPADNDFVE